MYGIMTSGNQTVDAMGMINISGNITPQIWYSTITRPNGKPYLLAITLLADIVYWYRPVEVRDEQSGRIIGWNKRFKGQLLQKTYQQYADLYGESKRSIKAALDRLEELHIIKKVFRDVQYENGIVAYNLMFIALDTNVLYSFTYPEDSLALNENEETKAEKAHECTPESSVKTSISDNNSYTESFQEERGNAIVISSCQEMEASESVGIAVDFMDNATLPPTKRCSTPYKITHPLLQNDVPPPTKFCTTPLQNNVPPPTKFCKGTKNTTENTNIDNINQSINQENNNILILNGTDEMDRMNNYAQIVDEVKKNIEYDALKQMYSHDADRIDEIVALIVETLCVKRETVRINGTDYPYQLVKKNLGKLGFFHIQYVMDCMDSNTTKIGNIRAYLLTVLFNAPSTIKSYYKAAVNHDLHG